MHIYQSEGIIIYFGDQKQSVAVEQLGAGALGIQKQINRLLPSNQKDIPFFFPRQVHGVDGFEVTDQTLDSLQSFTLEADFMITKQQNIGLGIVTADCVPLILYDHFHRACAIIHAGWRGSMAGILKRTVNMMRHAHASKPDGMQLIIGPAARGCCYEIGSEVLQALKAYAWYDHVLKERNGRLYCDMVLFNAYLARELEIKETSINIDYADCTMCNLQYCSYRRQGMAAQRQMSIAFLRND